MRVAFLGPLFIPILLSGYCLAAPPSLDQPTVIFVGCAASNDNSRTLDAGLEFGGKAFVLKNERLWIWPMEGSGGKFWEHEAAKSVPVLGPAVQAGFSRAPLFRAGAFWRQDGSQILKWDQRAHQWLTALKVSGPFQSFEVTYNGDILILGTKNNLVERFGFGEAKPSMTAPYPNLPHEPEFRPHVWDALVTGAFNEMILIYASGLGSLYAYSALETGTLKEMQVPWKRLDLDKEYQRWLKDGLVVLSGFPGPGCLQFIPAQDGGIKVAYKIKNVIGEVQWLPAAPGQLPELKMETQPGALRIGEIGNDFGSVSEGEEAGSMDLPLWYTVDGKFQPLSRLLSQESDTPTPERQPSKAAPINQQKREVPSSRKETDAPGGAAVRENGGKSRE